MESEQPKEPETTQKKKSYIYNYNYNASEGKTDSLTASSQLAQSGSSIYSQESPDEEIEALPENPAVTKLKVRQVSSTDSTLAITSSISRADSDISEGSTIDNVYVTSEWHERFLKILETNFQDETARKSELIRLLLEFTDSVKSIVRLIVEELHLSFDEKTIKPVNKGFAGGEKFLYKGLFLKFARDDKGVYGGDHIAMKAAGHEYRCAWNMILRINLKGLYFPLLTVIDYCGYRVMVSTKIPIGDETLVYGSNDGGETIVNSSSQFESLMQNVAESLHLKKHPVSENLQELFFGPADLEGHLGKDGRWYMLDLARLLPPLMPDEKMKRTASVLTRRFRFEFMMQYQGKALSSDTYSGFERHDTNKGANRTEVEQATDHLIKVILKKFVQEVLEKIKESGGKEFLESFDVTRELHARGVNLNLLGHMYKEIPNPQMKSQPKTYVALSQATLGPSQSKPPQPMSVFDENLIVLKNILLIEMIARATKCQIFKEMRKLSQFSNLACAEIVVKNLNLLLGYYLSFDVINYRNSLKSDINTKFGMNLLTQGEAVTQNSGMVKSMDLAYSKTVPGITKQKSRVDLLNLATPEATTSAPEISESHSNGKSKLSISVDSQHSKKISLQASLNNNNSDSPTKNFKLPALTRAPSGNFGEVDDVDMLLSANENKISLMRRVARICGVVLSTDKFKQLINAPSLIECQPFQIQDVKRFSELHKEPILSPAGLFETSKNDFSGMNRDKITDHYKLDIKELESDSYSVLLNAESLMEPGKLVVVKRIFKYQLRLVYKYINILKSLQHPHILPIYEYFEDENQMDIVMKRTPHSLADLVDLDTSKPVDEQETRVIVSQLLDVVSYIHSKNIIHRNLKPSNIYYERDSSGIIHVYVGGFEVATETGRFGMTYVGADAYKSPELLVMASNKQPSKAADMWSVGILTCALLKGKNPFYDSTSPPLAVILNTNKLDHPFEEDIEISPEAKSFVKHLLEKDPVKRYSSEEARAHLWIQNMPSKKKFSSIRKKFHTLINNVFN